MLEAIVVIILLLRIASPEKAPSQPSPPEEFGRDRLEVSFEILDGGALVISLDRRIPGFTNPPLEALYLVLADEVVRLDTMAQLRGRVAIRSAVRYDKKAYEKCRKEKTSECKR